MEKMNLKKGLFGYTEASVFEYIEAVNSEMKARTQKLTDENEKLRKKCERYESEKGETDSQQDGFLQKIASLSKEKEDIQAENSSLAAQIAELKAQLNTAISDKANYEQGQTEIADVMLEAKRFANELKSQTEREYENKKAENDEKIRIESQRIEKYISDVDEICGVLRKICEDMGEEVGKQKKDFNVVLSNLKALNVKRG